MSTLIIVLILAASLLASSILMTNWMKRIEDKIDSIERYTDAMKHVMRNANVVTNMYVKDGKDNTELKTEVVDILDKGNTNEN